MIYDNSKAAINKLIILYILEKMEMPLTKTQINNIVLENNLINYFALQQNLSEMESSELIRSIETQQKVSFTLTEGGSKTLSIFVDKIPQNTRNLLNEYVRLNKDKIKKEAQIFADFSKKSEKEYIVNLKVVENEMVLIDLNLSVVSAKQAKFICEKWKNSSEKIYSQIMNTLITQY